MHELAIVKPASHELLALVVGAASENSPLVQSLGASSGSFP